MAAPPPDLPLDRLVRHRVYAALAAGGHAPAPAQLAGALGVEAEAVRASLARLHDAHKLVLDAAGEVRMALPFSNVETAYRVEAGRAWWANCAWDSLAIVRLMGLERARIVDVGGPSREGRTLTVAGGALAERDGVISFPLPAWRWWDDIVFT